MSWRDKDREEESVDGITHCDFAKRKEGERWRTCACVKTLDGSGQKHKAGMRRSLLVSHR